MNFRTTDIGRLILRNCNKHKNSEHPNIFIFSTPRSGSTWTKELFSREEGMKFVNEPFNFRNPEVSKYFKSRDWDFLYSQEGWKAAEKYIESIELGSVDTAFLNTFPLKENYRYSTNRIVYKILHGLEDRIEDVRLRFGGKIVYLIRHPIAVSLSRKYCPRLQVFCNSEFANHFTESQLSYARHTIQKGTYTQKLMLSWCMQNYVPLRDMNKDWILITYEQLTTQPGKVLEVLCDHLNIDNKNSILDGIGKASDSTNLSNIETLEKFKVSSGAELSSYLVSKWMKKIDPTAEYELMKALDVFDLDIYKAGDCMPNKRYLF